MSNLIEVFRAFARREARIPEVMRAIGEHPAFLVCQAGGERWAFSDRERADAARVTAGVWISGVELLRAGDGVAVRINPGGRVDDGWWIGREGFATAREWAAIVGLEQVLRSRLDASWGHRLIAALEAVPTLHVLTDPDGALATALHARGFRRVLMVFTSIDAAQRVAAARPELALTPRAWRAVHLYDRAAEIGYDAVVINAGGPGAPCPVPMTMLRLLAGAAVRGELAS